MGTREVPQADHAGTRPVADDMTAVAGQTAGKESFVGRYSVAAYEPALGPAGWADKVKMSSDLALDSYKDEQVLGSSMLRPQRKHQAHPCIAKTSEARSGNSQPGGESTAEGLESIAAVWMLEPGTWPGDSLRIREEA